MITNYNENLILQLMSATVKNPNISQYQPLINHFSTTIPTATESLISSWIRQNQTNTCFATVPNEIDSTILNSTARWRYNTALLQLQSIIEQQRQMMAMKQQNGIENLLRLLTTNNMNMISDLLGAAAQQQQQFLLTKQQQFNVADLQFNQINGVGLNKISQVCNSSVACSSTSTSRDSTPPQSIQQLNHSQESAQHYQPHNNTIESLEKCTVPTDVAAERTIVKDAEKQHTVSSTRKRSYKDAQECDGTRPSSSTAHSDVVPSKKKIKTLKKRLMDNVTNSPVSGMFIKDNCTSDDLLKAAELDDTASYVHISEEARKNISAIPDVIGDSICALCRIKYEDVFRLAMHRCPRIIHEEYRCPECEKIFSCPANLASHRRWHRPRSGSNATDGTVDPQKVDQPVSVKFSCANCSSTFTAKKAFCAHKKSCGINTVATTDSTDSVDCTAQKIGRAEAKTAQSVDSQSLESFSAAAALISLGMSSRVCV